jgi:hypothetical protein
MFVVGLQECAKVKRMRLGISDRGRRGEVAGWMEGSLVVPGSWFLYLLI